MIKVLSGVRLQALWQVLFLTALSGAILPGTAGAVAPSASAAPASVSSESSGTTAAATAQIPVADASVAQVQGSDTSSSERAPQQYSVLPSGETLDPEQAAALPQTSIDLKEKFSNLNLPCPAGWTVLPNPGMDNSLSYLEDSGRLAVSVTSIQYAEDIPYDPAIYARVASDQLKCMVPEKANMLENAWSFLCPERGVEAVIYASDKQGSRDMVLLAISGRNPDTEKSLEGFIRFLAWQAKNG